MSWYKLFYKISFYYVIVCVGYMLIVSMAFIVILLAIQYGLMELIKFFDPSNTWYLVKKGIFLELPAILLPVAVPWFIYYLTHGKIRKPEWNNSHKRVCGYE